MGCTPGHSIGPQVPDGTSQVTLSPCASGPCQNGATCIPLATSFMCSCSAGYTGFLCQNQIDNCANTPCLNGGTCTSQVGSFTCQCSSEYTGDRCQDEVNKYLFTSIVVYHCLFRLKFVVEVTLEILAKLITQLELSIIMLITKVVLILLKLQVIKLSM